MISVAICDDNLNDLSNTKTIVEQVLKLHDAECDLHAYDSPKKILDKINAGTIYDVYFLEINYSNISGIELAKFIKSKNKDSKIVFITSSKDKALDAFSVNAVHYVIKPLSVLDAQEIYKRIVKKANEIDHYIIKKTSSGIMKIDVNSIQYSESNGHYQYLYLENGEILKIRIKTQELWKELKEYSSFLRPHSGYIVNMTYIDSISSKGIKIGDVELPMAKNTLNHISKIFIEYNVRKG